MVLHHSVRSTDLGNKSKTLRMKIFRIISLVGQPANDHAILLTLLSPPHYTQRISCRKNGSILRSALPILLWPSYLRHPPPHPSWPLNKAPGKNPKKTVVFSKKPWENSISSPEMKTLDFPRITSLLYAVLSKFCIFVSNALMLIVKYLRH